MPEPLNENEKATVKLHLTPFNLDEPVNSINFFKDTLDVKLDHFSQFSAENQMKKLISKDIPKYVGLNTIGVNLQKDGSLITWFNHDFNNGYSSGYFNPHKKIETLKKIEIFFKKESDKFKKVEN